MIASVISLSFEEKGRVFLVMKISRFKETKTFFYDEISFSRVKQHQRDIVLKTIAMATIYLYIDRTETKSVFVFYEIFFIFRQPQSVRAVLGRK